MRYRAPNPGGLVQLLHADSDRAVMIPVDLGVPPPLLVTQGMDEGLVATGASF
jgi:hypothetical protein